MYAFRIRLICARVDFEASRLENPRMPLTRFQPDLPLLRLRLAALLSASLALTAPASNWPQWRGPERNGISTETVMPFPASGPHLLWSASVGTGFSSISLADGRAYTMGNSNAQDSIFCFDAANGHELWRHSYSAR